MPRLLLVAVGYAAAVLAAGLVIGLALHGPALRWGDAGWFATWVLLAAGSVAAVAVLPFAVAVAFAETRGICAPWPWPAFGVALGLAAHGLLRFTGDPADAVARLLAFAAAGCVAGLVYWLVAGRRAGEGSRTA